MNIITAANARMRLLGLPGMTIPFQLWRLCLTDLYPNTSTTNASNAPSYGRISVPRESVQQAGTAHSQHVNAAHDLLLLYTAIPLDNSYEPWYEE